MADKLYLVGYGSRLYATHIPHGRKDLPSRSCIIGMTSRKAAYKLSLHIKNTETVHEITDHEMFLPLIREVDYMDGSFYKMLKLNNFALLVAETFVIDEDGNEIAFGGNLIDVEYEIDDEYRVYFDHLLKKTY